LEKILFPFNFKVKVKKIEPEYFSRSERFNSILPALSVTLIILILLPRISEITRYVFSDLEGRLYLITMAFSELVAEKDEGKLTWDSLLFGDLRSDEKPCIKTKENKAAKITDLKKFRSSIL